MTTPPRSWLFCPADRLDRLAGAVARADAVIADLEDAVAPAGKPDARDGLVRWLRENPATATSVWVRVNSHPRYLPGDLDALTGGGTPLAGFVLPKAELSGVRSVAERTDRPLLPLLETAAGLWQAPEIASGATVYTLAIGEYDLSVELGTAAPDIDAAPLAWARSRVVAAVSAAGIAPAPAPVSAVLDDEAGFRADTAALQRWGFFGRMCVHPAQAVAVRELLTPTTKEIDRAREIVERAEQAEREGAGVLVIDGRMVDLAVVRRARRTLALAE
ncbi:HpcH/HpaI aldolase/citrate lyase family protein [Nocardia vaccinii]|uniref:HpcH/HpaI aldolase/citrate lyase family protein n=1 Tax=Nocardia vaccinii TaxID=1822 RepID=UPI0008336B07|nr:CoA ester lyase [Nocardia vaccinii]